MTRVEDSDRRSAVLELLQSNCLSAREVDSLFEKCIDMTYWRRLNPDLTVEGEADCLEAEPLSPDDVAKKVAGIHRRGYFRTHPILDLRTVGRMRACVEGMRAERWPPVFSFVYDQFWQSVRTPSLARLIAGFLGDRYSQNSKIWTYYVAGRGARGWRPHDDSGDAASRLTVWVALSDANVENGCIYVIPHDLVPETIPRSYDAITSLNRGDLDVLLQAARALPAPAGAFLGWNHQLIHWGSWSSGETMPRISFAVEFIAESQRPWKRELPLLEMHCLPPFNERLRAIGKAIVDYRRFELPVWRYTGLAARLAAIAG